MNKKENQSGAANKAAPQIKALQEIGKAFSKARAHKDLTLQQVAELSGLSFPYLQKLEKGKLANASLQSLFKATQAVGVNLILLLT